MNDTRARQERSRPSRAVPPGGSGARGLVIASGQGRERTPGRFAAGTPLPQRMAALALLVLFALLTWCVRQGGTRALDLAIVQAAAQHVGPEATAFMEWTTRLGVVLILLAPCLTLGLIGRRRIGALSLVLASELGAAALNAALKAAIRRPAPGMDVPQPIDASNLLARLLAPFGSWYSFPSGHTVGAVVSFGLLAYVAGRQQPRAMQVLAGLAAVVGVALLGLSRVALARHYPSDVLGALLVGGAWLVGTLGLLRRALGARRAVAHARQGEFAPATRTPGG